MYSSVKDQRILEFVRQYHFGDNLRIRTTLIFQKFMKNLCKFSQNTQNLQNVK